MPLLYRISPQLHLLFIRGVGVISQVERIETMQAWLKDPAYADCETALCDFTAADSTPTMAELRELVDRMSRLTPGRGPKKLALIATKAITFVVGGEFKQFVEIAAVPLEVRVFEEIGLAWEWLHGKKDRPAE